MKKTAMFFIFLLLCFFLFGQARTPYTVTINVSFDKGIERYASGSVFHSKKGHLIVAVPLVKFISGYKKIDFKKKVKLVGRNSFWQNPVNIVQISEEDYEPYSNFMYLHLKKKQYDFYPLTIPKKVSPAIGDSVYYNDGTRKVYGRISETLSEDNTSIEYQISFQENVPDVSGYPLFDITSEVVGIIFQASDSAALAQDITSIENRINTIAKPNGKFRKFRKLSDIVYAGFTVAVGTIVLIGEGYDWWKDGPPPSFAQPPGPPN